MPPVYKFRAPDGSITDITSYFRLYTLDVATNAEEGSVAQSTVRADDPSGDFDIVGHRIFQVTEDTATGSNTAIYTGYTAGRRILRGDYRTTTARVWDIDLVDLNSVLARRVMNGSDANRPAETDVARVQWLLGTNEASIIDDSLYVSTSGAVSMDAVDYRGQRFNDVLDDCAQASGKNYFVWLRNETGNFSLWYDFASSTSYSSPLRLTNVLSEIDETWTFAISPDTQLSRSPDRVNSGAHLPYDGGTVYVQSNATAAAFAQRDAVMPAENVKSLAKATARATRYLGEMDSEEDVITTTIVLPATKVNFLMQGMRVQFKATHLPGYDVFTWVRALNRSVLEVSEEYYEVKLELSTEGSYAAPVVSLCAGGAYPETASGTYAPLNTNVTNSDAVFYYAKPGTVYPEGPTPGHAGQWNFPDYGSGGSPDYAGDNAGNTIVVMVVGEGTLSIPTTTYLGVLHNLTASLLHGPIGALAVVDSSQAGVTGDTFTFTVSSHGGTECVHRVEIIERTPILGGGKFGFAGATWTRSV